MKFSINSIIEESESCWFAKMQFFSESYLVISLIYAFFCQSFTLVAGQSRAEDDYYVAAVVEFHPVQFNNSLNISEGIAKYNLDGYLDILASPTIDPADIVVFPEMTLNDNNEATFVPNPKDSMEAPCDTSNNQKFNEFLVKLSCEARRLSKYIVINIAENDSGPSDDGKHENVTLYNTNVVFDRNGTVISRYRKIHLWGENRNSSDTQELGYFDTDFGVRFGHFTCFDILFYRPSQELVADLRIRDIIFPTMWFSQLPFLTSTQIQAAYSYANNVNLLAAGASYPPVGTTGTGIYAGRSGIIQAVVSLSSGQRNVFVSRVKKLTYEMPSVTKRKLHKRNIPTMPDIRKTVTGNEIFLKRDQLENYTTHAIDFENNTSLQKTLCYRNGSFCCNFDLEWQHLNVLSSSVYYSYRLGVLNAWRKEEAPETNYLRNCAIFTCIGNDIMDCGKAFPAYVSNVTPKIAFTRIVIEANFPHSKQMLLMPNTLRDNLMPLNATDFQWKVAAAGVRRRKHKARLTLNTTTSNLMTFSIYGNYFDDIDIGGDEEGDDDDDGGYHGGIINNGKGAASQLKMYSGFLLISSIMTVCLRILAI